jgi:glutathione S-transferase
MLRLYDSRLSGNAWKVRILLTQLGIPFERVTLDLAKGAAAEPAFRAKSRRHCCRPIAISVLRSRAG